MYLEKPESFVPSGLAGPEGRDAVEELKGKFRYPFDAIREQLLEEFGHGHHLAVYVDPSFSDVTLALPVMGRQACPLQLPCEGLGSLVEERGEDEEGPQSMV